MKLGIVGGGVVGKATARAFIEHVDEVRVYDLDSTRRTHWISETRQCDIVFVCLPTPMADDGSCDTTALDQFFDGEKRIGLIRTNFVIRSTVPIGYTRKLLASFPSIVHSPEFLTARCADVDAQMPSRNVIGGQSLLLWQLYRKRWPHVPCLHMSSDESEAVKLIQNAFFATKVAFFNEAYSLCEKLELDFDTVRDAILADGRIATSHTKVPGPDGLFGFGGTCLPKDLSNYVHHLHDASLPAWVAQAALLRNKEDRHGN